MRSYFWSTSCLPGSIVIRWPGKLLEGPASIVACMTSMIMMQKHMKKSRHHLCQNKIIVGLLIILCVYIRSVLLFGNGHHIAIDATIIIVQVGV